MRLKLAGEMLFECFTDGGGRFIGLKPRRRGSGLYIWHSPKQTDTLYFPHKFFGIFFQIYFCSIFFIHTLVIMKAIFKYILPMKEESSIEMPYGAVIIKGENQEGFVAIWALCDGLAPLVKRNFRLYKTGQEVREQFDRLVFIGRADIHVGMDLGMHIFELI